jgi:hypothetical protein
VPDTIGAAALEAVEHLDAPPEDMIRRECVKVSIIKAEMLHRIPKTAPVPRDIVLSFHTRLQEFHNQLPTWMSLSQLVANEPSDRMTQLRPVIFYVHLFYLSAMMLLSRRLVIAYVALDATGEVFFPTEVRRAIQDGFEAAQSNAQVMALMVSEGKVVQVCWLCMYVLGTATVSTTLTLAYSFTSYTAGVMIAYGAVQKAVHGLSFAFDMEVLNKCIEVLTYCARKDAMAGKFRVLLTRQLDELHELHVSANTRMDAEADRTAQNDVLFRFNPGSSKLHDSVRKLLNLIQRPFAGLSDTDAKDIMSNRAETTMGTHLEWAWEFKRSQNLKTMAESETPCGKSPRTLDDGVDPIVMESAGAAAWSTWTPSAGT